MGGHSRPFVPQWDDLGSQKINLCNDIIDV